MWHNDKELHRNVCIRNVKKIEATNATSIYADTDSLFVSFKPAIENCDWKNLFFNNLDKINKKFVIIQGRETIDAPEGNPFCVGVYQLHFEDQENIGHFKDIINTDKPDVIIVDGKWIKNRDFNKLMKELDVENKIKWNWSFELDFIHGIDNYRYAGYFKKCLEDYAAGYGVKNREDFELERISESVIYIAKKKYIQNIRFEDGIPYDELSYFYSKGVEIVRRSTPLFVRDKIMEVIKYIFSHPDTFNIKDLLKQVKTLRKEFDLCVPDMVDDISMQSSCSNYDQYVLEDTNKLVFADKAPASVKAAAYYNHMLHKNKELQSKYEFLKSGSKIKYYYCKDASVNKIFAFIRGTYPIEFAPEVDLDLQFEKCMLSPINSIIAPLGMPEITRRLSVVLDIFGGSLKKKNTEVDETDDLESNAENTDWKDWDY